MLAQIEQGRALTLLPKVGRHKSLRVPPFAVVLLPHVMHHVKDHT